MLLKSEQAEKSYIYSVEEFSRYLDIYRHFILEATAN